MCKEGKTIYHASRLQAEMSRELAAEQLHVSVESIGAYERGETKIPCELVAPMALLYQDPMLAFRHMTICCPVGKEFLPNIVERDGPTAVLSLQKEVGDVTDRGREMINAALDGTISKMEALHKEVRDMIGAAISLLMVGGHKKGTPGVDARALQR